LIGFVFAPLAAQDAVPPNRGGFTESMGVPQTWRWSLGFSARTHRDPDEAHVALQGSGVFYRDILNPMTAALGIMGEAYFGQRGAFEGFIGGLDGGARLSLFSPVARLGFGVDYNVTDDEFDFLVSLIHPLHRGGIFVGGGALRVDYLPGRSHSAGIGVQLPIGQKYLGRTRPRDDHIELSNHEPRPDLFRPSVELSLAVANAQRRAHWVNRATVPFTDHWDGDQDEALELFASELNELRDHFSAGVTPIGDVETYHREMERAFSIATSGQEMGIGESTPLGVRTWRVAREIVLDRVLLPYNRLLGQKKKPDSTRGLGTAASAEFYEWLGRETPVAEDRLLATIWTLQRLLDIVESTRAYNRQVWGDSRFVWLPFQLALKPDEHDEQAELNALVERATTEEFTRGNNHWYVENEQFQAELTRMILEAEDYQVLWIHDIRGYDALGAPDEMSFRQVVDGYLRALINRVNAYDAVGKIPQYIIVIDQMYFEANGGQLWIDLLQSPLHHQIDLPDEYQAWEDSIAGIQAELRDAVAGSEVMQAQATLHEDGWVENLVKVHVNVTNPPDPSFWTAELFPFFMGLSDVIMRDHRKIAFYDVTEADPYKGMAIYTGMGVGEHYIGASWEDRAMMVQGPVLLSLKNSARQLLLNQGFSDDEIPWELRPKEMAADYDEMVADSLAVLGAWGWDMQLHNQIGFRFKAVSVFKATLYTLMPQGSVIKAPDSIWGSHFLGSLMLGHALRGGRSLVIAPSIDNAPSAGFPQMSRAQDILTRLVVAGQLLEKEIEGQGGLLKVGLYNSALSVGDIPGKMRSLGATLETTPWLRELYSFHPAVLTELRLAAASLIEGGFSREYSVDQEHTTPKLHLKGNYFATPEAWDLLSRPDIAPAVVAYFKEMALQNQALADGEYRSYRHLSETLLPLAHPVIESYMSGLPDVEQKRAALFFSVGSHNQNTRSLVLDGEAAFVVAGWSALFGIPDFIVITGLCRWIDDLSELEELFPRYEGLQRRISRWIRIAV
jgi:hypothetical protein